MSCDTAMTYNWKNIQIKILSQELNEILANLDLQGYYNSPSPDSYQFWPFIKSRTQISKSRLS